MVEVTIGWGGEFEGSETNVIKSLVIDDHDFVGVLDQLMDRESSVIWLNDGIGYLGRWEN